MVFPAMLSPTGKTAATVPISNICLKSQNYLRGKTDVRQDETKEMQQLLDDPEFLIFARHTQKIPEADRSRILRNFRDTIDVYLRAIGIEEDEQE